MAWQSSSKPDRDREDEKSVLYIALLGFIGLLLEALGVWMLFSWFSKPPRRLGEPTLLIGGVTGVLGFVILTRWLAAVIKALLR